MILRLLIAAVFMLLRAAYSPASAHAGDAVILFPKDHSIVYDKVNLVLDPADAPVFQAVVGAAEYPLVDTSSGKHALQGLVLTPGINTITVKIFKSSGEPAAGGLKLVATREITVFSRVEIYAKGATPEGYREQFFHTRQQEEYCSGCHDLKAGKQGEAPQKPEDVICYVCHREMPAGDKKHPPAADWDCLACHDPDLYPARYQFVWKDPWKVSKDVKSVQQLSLSVALSELFEPGNDKLLSGDKAVELFQNVINHAKQNPYDKVRLKIRVGTPSPIREPYLPSQYSNDAIRLELPSDDTLIRKGPEKAEPIQNPRAVAEARVRSLTAFLLEYGIKEEQLTATGTEYRLSEEPRPTGDGQPGDRVEIVINPPGETERDATNAPSPQDRERTTVRLDYAQGPDVKKLRAVVTVPKGRQYVKGSSAVGGKSVEPVVVGDELIWELGDGGGVFSESLTYVLSGGDRSLSEAATIRLVYTADDHEIAKEIGPSSPPTRVRTVEDVCMTCHGDTTEGKYKHAPAGTGYCNLCHNPHASGNSALLRKPVRLVCLDCHGDKASGVHVIAGNGKDSSHPTKKRNDPSRPGRELSCVSCHNPHGAEIKTLLAFKAKNRFEICVNCHRM